MGDLLGPLSLSVSLVLILFTHARSALSKGEGRVSILAEIRGNCSGEEGKRKWGTVDEDWKLSRLGHLVWGK